MAFQSVRLFYRNRIKLYIREQTVKISSVLMDGFNRQHTYLRISVTERCSFRCQYCMPEEGVSLTPAPKLLTNEEIIYLTSLFSKVGVNKVRFTGGEPLIRKNITELIGSVSELKSIKTIGLTTNGLVLHRKLSELKKAGLNALNISLDTLVPEKFEFITRRSGFHQVMRSINAAIDMKLSPLKINCVVIKGINDDEMVDFVKLTENKNIDVRFIEYCPFTGNKWMYDKMVPYLEMLNMIKQQFPNLTRLSDSQNDTSKAYKVPGFKGQIGFITSMTENFCSSCNRLRITADGNLKVCLFGKEEISLRDPLRQNASEKELLNIISSAILKKKKQHAETRMPKHSNFCENLKTVFPSESETLNLLRKLNPQKLIARFYSHSSVHLTHLDDKGKINMIDVSSKPKSIRIAEAEARIYLGETAFNLVVQNKIKKGDVLSVANIAGIMAAKKTSELIPLCHCIQIDEIKINFELISNEKEILIKSHIKCVDRTGAEMEALTAATVAALTIYDMCKAVSKEMVLKSVNLHLKTGGKQDYKST